MIEKNQRLSMVYDFHTHTFLSDGALSPIEQIRRAIVKGYTAIGLTDHVGLGNLADVLRQVITDCALARRYWQIEVVAGVEITHAPAASIAGLASYAKELGAAIVLVHGETLVEPVEPGTNMAAIKCPDVDVLAHPGLLTLEEAILAAQNGTFIEISARKGHSLSNGHLANICRQAGARLLVNSDAHSPEDLLTTDFARAVALGAGLAGSEIETVLVENPRRLLATLSAGARRPDSNTCP
ncbi:MAG: histidinol phosphate phosphatase domain-containing protein [Dehalococcoidia bacterium]|nr:histidinol phosphate phosphatase domain-containing protein [Dehalococcoidia bacterium]